MERITISEIENGERFYRLPKAFFEMDRYKKMSLEAKTLYAFLKDRSELSIKNKWVDSEGCVYFIFTIEDLKEMTGWGKDKVIKHKKELGKYNLLEEERQGLSKPNRLYLGKIETEFSTGIKSVESTEVGKSEVKNSKNQKSKGRKNRNLEVENIEANDTDKSETDKNEYSSSRKADSNSQEFDHPTKTNDIHVQEKSGKYIPSQYYSLLQVIADKYDDRFIYPKGYTMTHQQKMKIGEYLESGYTTSSEILDMIDRIPHDCDSPLAYLLKMLENLTKERKMEERLLAHRRARMRFDEVG